MEANKETEVKETKQVVMTPKGNGGGKSEQRKPLTYEELVNVCNQLQRQGQELYNENKQLKNQAAIVRVNFLFDILKNKEMFLPEVVQECSREITYTLFPQPEDTEEGQGQTQE